MRIWLTQTSEPYPFLPGVSSMRTGNLAAELVRRGHEVVWWGSNIEHRRKQPLEAGVYEIAPGYTVRLLAVPPYTRNVSWRRYRGYKQLARAFERESRALPEPDVIVAGLPVHDLAWAAVRYASGREIPSLVDVRDLWPDYFVDLLPPGLRTLGRVALRDDFHRARFALSNATGIIGISKSYLEWGLDVAGRSAREADSVFFLGCNPLGPVDAAPVPLRRDRKVFGFLGVFGHTYDLETVIAAARILHESGDDRAHFALAGTGDFFERVSRAAEGLPNVSLPGWLDAAGVDSFLRGIDVGLAAYAAGAPQSLPNKPFQYFAAGAPVVSSLGGEFRDLLAATGTGVTYRAGDPESLAEAVRRFLDAPGLIDEMGKRAHSHFRASFDARVIYPRLADHVELVAAVLQGQVDVASAAVGGGT